MLRRLLMASLVLVVGLAPSVFGETPRVLDRDQRPADRRLGPLVDLNGYFPFRVAESPRQWKIRSEQVRRQLRVALGLWPQPTTTPLNAVIHGRIERDDYTVEKVYFESMPGFYVTGSLYRPKGPGANRPAVLCPHGHWSNGRFYDTGIDEVRKQIERGGEQFEEGGRSPLQARCVQLARMGCVVFHYDMIGYADNLQISFEVAHRFAKQRPEMSAATNWGLFSPQAESHGQSVMGLQTWNSIRALDFVSKLPDVDKTRLAVTGASGGGTQTFILAALDSRPAVAFPAVMVSTAMQGGCTCENACGLRIGTGNVEFAALFAPKPIGLTAANDWTREMESKGFPELQQHYQMLDAGNNAMLLSRVEFNHNYNSVSRHAMYQWFNRHLSLDLPEPIQERDYTRLTQQEMSVWDDDHPRPEGGPDFERRLLRWWHEDTRRRLAELKPKDKASLREYREVVGGSIDAVIGRELPAAKDVQYDQSFKQEHDDYIHMMGLLRNNPHGEELPIAFLYPKQWRGRVVVWLDGRGKAALFEENGEPALATRTLLEQGATVVGVDLLYQGEFLGDAKPLERTRRVENPREAAAYTFGYNRTVFAQRVHDVLSVIAYLQNHEMAPTSIELVGIDGLAGAWAAAARAQARGVVTKAAINTNGFRFSSVTDIRSLEFLPGGASADDLPGMLAVAAPNRLWLAGEGANAPAVVTAAYAATESPGALELHGDGSIAAAALEWLSGSQ